MTYTDFPPTKLFGSSLLMSIAFTMLETNNNVKISIIFDNFILFWIFRLTLFDYEYTLPKNPSNCQQQNYKN